MIQAQYRGKRERSKALVQMQYLQKVGGCP